VVHPFDKPPTGAGSAGLKCNRAQTKPAKLLTRTVTALFRGIPGLKIETWGTQIRWIDYKITRSLY
jgi:hypothetical protein